MNSITYKDIDALDKAGFLDNLQRKNREELIFYIIKYGNIENFEALVQASNAGHFRKLQLDSGYLFSVLKIFIHNGTPETIKGIFVLLDTGILDGSNGQDRKSVICRLIKGCDIERLEALTYAFESDFFHSLKGEQLTEVLIILQASLLKRRKSTK